MARPKSDLRLVVLKQLEQKPLTLADICAQHGLSMSGASKLIERLIYANQVMVVDKVARENCKRKVAVYKAKAAA